MVILISPENDLQKELQILHQLFDAGLAYYHLRKPNYTIDQYQAYLEQIDAQFHKNIMIHNYHKVTKDYAVKGIHLEERKWREKEAHLASYVKSFKENDFYVSSSYHEMEDLAKQAVIFDYYMLSPVFAAISKPGYKGRGFEVSHIPKKIVGMGGINAETTPEALALGFKGVGTLGGIWNSQNPIEAFKKIKRAFTNTSSL